jgi:hypothetical protein
MPGGILKPPAPLHPVANAQSEAPPTPSVIKRHGGNLKAQICGASYVALDALAPGEELTVVLKSWRDHLGDAEVPAMQRKHSAGRARRRPP